MNVAFAAVICTGIGVADLSASTPPSFLYQPAYALDKGLRGPVRPYVPQPGDIILAASDDLWSILGHVAAGTGHPNHSMIVFAQHDGTLAILEAGPHGRLREGMAIVSLSDNLREYQNEGRVWIRARKTPLTPAESARLTEFAYHVAGRPFARWRTYAQVTPLRTRMPLRAALVGGANPDKRSYFCSELVLNAVRHAGLVDEEIRPAATYPRDIFFDRSRNPVVNRSLQQFKCGWEPPARWTECLPPPEQSR